MTLHDVSRPVDVGQLFAEHAAHLLRYCRGRLDAEDAEDVVAQAFLVAHRRRDHYRPGGAGVRAWLFGIATNLIREHRRAEVRRLRALARLPAAMVWTADHAERAVERLDGSARGRRALAALAGLSRRQRDVLLLYAVAELTYEEIADAAGMPVGSVRSTLHRARTKIRIALEGDLND
jgi:RNA polymerase sigma factor (sigma-70 family)